MASSVQTSDQPFAAQEFVERIHKFRESLDVKRVADTNIWKKGMLDHLQSAINSINTYSDFMSKNHKKEAFNFLFHVWQRLHYVLYWFEERWTIDWTLIQKAANSLTTYLVDNNFIYSAHLSYYKGALRAEARVQSLYTALRIEGKEETALKLWSTSLQGLIIIREEAEKSLLV